MNGEIALFWIMQLLVLLLGVSIGHTLLLFRLQREKNRGRALELAVIEKRKEVLKQGKQVASNLEDVLYTARRQKEIDDIIKNDRSSRG